MTDVTDPDAMAKTTPRKAPAPRKTRAGEAKAARILDTAVDVFARYGFHGARVERIAAAVGMSKTNLLYYFRTKEELYVAALRRVLDMWLDPLRELDVTQDPRKALEDYIARKLALSRSHPTASRLFAMEILQGAPHLKPVLEGPLAALVAQKAEVIAAWTAQGRLAPVAPRHLIFAIWATTQHYADFAAQIQALTGRDLSDETFHDETLRAVSRLLLDGVLPRGGD
ncbi:HTH-type transcriptional regulator RutR [Chelatococcus sp. SYSU_G07232]|uniref:HTH-type transcriptional regulator RutR n=1 Tax=Chelatococcus albus TaxID=3047466 RepID=A0ABT7AKI8_9HYPH|nr:HTH-type transcriptional regulator RutR [Chelatococcus sp. SYSU_G07232]MDJ1159354.1 HTH-type transcriptional regulator RutR [Chelatococcus sp. SYSU_G07232]